MHIVVADTYCVMYFVLLAFILCVQCYQFFWIVQSWLFLRFSLTFIWNRNDMDTYYLSTMIRIRSQCFIVLFKVYVIMYVSKPQMLLLSPPPFLCDHVIPFIWAHWNTIIAKNIVVLCIFSKSKWYHCLILLCHHM